MNKMRYLRIACALAALAAIAVFTQVDVASGTLCVLCPVGFAEISLASGSVPWELLPGVVAVLAVVFLLGRVFCSWVCPTSLIRNVFGGRMPRGLTGRTGSSCADASRAGKVTHEMYALRADTHAFGEDEGSAQTAGSTESAGFAQPADTTQPTGFAQITASAKSTGSAVSATHASCTNCSREHSNLASQGIVLAVLLVVSFVVHFPVFCLICPIGLAMGTVFAASRTFLTWQPEWELIVFPALLLAEALLLRRWCTAICPWGFFFDLVATLRTRTGLSHVALRPHAAKSTCIADEGCHACERVCPENINVTHATAYDLEDCTGCLDCREHCPTCSISLPSAKDNQPR